MITTLIDPEIEILSKNRSLFENIGVEVLAPYESSAEYCFDKYKFYLYCKENGINTVDTYNDLNDFLCDYNAKKIDFPVFVKPRTGSGSVGAKKVENIDDLTLAVTNDDSLIIQRFMGGIDLDADVYVDTISKEPVAIFTKKKLETKIGGASKTISFKDDVLFEAIKKVLSKMKFNGPIDMDFFYCDGEYYVSEINPRFGGAYLHAYGAGVDFVRLIKNNVEGKANRVNVGNYDDGIYMLMYDSVVIVKEEDK